MHVVYDTEIFPNCFLLCAKGGTGRHHQFEISSRRNDSVALLWWLSDLKKEGREMIGFNNLNFDYPLLHFIINSRTCDPAAIYRHAMAIINCENKFQYMVFPSDRYVPQIDLFRVHHFDNKARMTSLKALEFNMRMPNIEDLPFPVRSMLSHEQMDVLADYCRNDVEATVSFLKHSREQLDFRKQLSEKYGRDFMNYSDVKIGKEIFQISLEKVGVTCYTYGPEGREPKQTKRPRINLADCVPPYIRFDHPEFNRIKRHFETTTITQTKGAFDKLVANVGGLEFKFGTGGLHASVDKEAFESNGDYMIHDVDVTSLYPSIAIENNLYPEHLGPVFVQVYRQLRQQRVSHKKGTAENAMLKLALNGVYGASNDPFSVFFDPLFTMRITIGGQLMLAMLAEQLLMVAGVRIIQCNTDGITLWMPRTAKFIVDAVCSRWERITRLSLETAEYRKMFVADVNSYLAQTVDGKVKRKGRYEHDLEWHQDASALVVPKVAEKVLLEGAAIGDTLRNWPDIMDFMLRVKVTKGSRLVIEVDGQDADLERTQRYFISKDGYPMTKIMPPLAKKPDQWRRIGVQSGWKVVPCNRLDSVKGQSIDFDWYQQEIEKLVLEVL